MISWLAEPWTYPFMRWALACCLVLAGIHAYLGFHVVRRGILFVDLAMAQMAALGSAVGVIFGIEHDTFGGYLISAAFALATAGAFAVIRSRRVHQEAIIAIFYALAMACTFVVLEHSPHGMEEVKHLLIGQVLTVEPKHVLATLGAYAALGAILAALHTRIVAVTEKRVVNRAVDFAFYATFALVVTSSVGLVGVLLVFSLLVVPAVSALLLARSDVGRLAWGWGLALAGSLVGLHLAYHFDLPAAPVVVLALGLTLPFAAFARRRT
jgi:zinc/manganese transport system permease protein